MRDPTNVQFFATPAELRAWFELHHETAEELWLGYHRVGSGRPSLRWPEAVDEALCVGWIDGIRKSIDATSYANRFTPRRRDSNWSAINVARVADLTAQGRMRPSGLAAFALRRADRTGVYSFERNPEGLGAELEARFRAQPDAWTFFASQPPGYRKVATHWVLSAKREETRERRFATLVADSADGRRLAAVTSPPRKR